MPQIILNPYDYGKTRAKLSTIYLQSDTLNPAKRVYASLNYTDAYQHIKTASTFDSSSNTIFKVIPPIAYSSSNVNEHMVCQYYSIWTTLGDYYDYTEYSFKSAGNVQSAPILKGEIRSWDYGGDAGIGRGTGNVSWSCKANGQPCNIDETYHFTRKPNGFYQTRYGDIFLVNNGGHDQHNIDFNITSDDHSVDYYLDNPYVYLLSDSYVYYGTSARPGIDLYNFVIHLTDIYGNGFDYTKGIYTLSCGN